MNLSICKFDKQKIKSCFESVIKGFCWFLTGFILTSFVFGDGYAWHFVLCAAMPFFWIKTPTRARAFLVVLGYYLGATLDVPQGGTIFFGADTSAQGFAFLLWIGSALILALPWTVFWTNFKNTENHAIVQDRRCVISIRLFLALFFVIIPPIGTFGWANPIMGYAWLPFMTGRGYLAILIGVLCTALVMDYIFDLEAKDSKYVYFVKVAVVLFFAFCFLFETSPTIDIMNILAENTVQIRAIQANEGKLYSGSGGDSNTAPELRKFLQKYVKITDKDKFIILPETVCGNLNDEKIKVITDHISSSCNSDVTIYAGGEIPINSKRYENGLYCFCRSGIIPGQNYIQRFPVPVTQWVPFRNCIADWFGKSVFKIGNQRAACLICSEYVFAFPILASFIHLPFDKTNRPTMILAVSNQWWSVKTKIPNIQQQSLLSWCRLFGVPAVMAENRGL